MEYKITKEELGDDWLYRTLLALDQCMKQLDLPLYIVGARARDIAMKLLQCDEPKRHTEDLDIAIAVENWQAFDDICEILKKNHFKRYDNTQKFFYKGENGEFDYEIDVVPYGNVAVDEKISWPPNGNPVMSVRCYQDVLKNAMTIVVDDTIKMKIAPLCGQFIIKLDAWNDRKDLTDKDAEDMLFILKNYLNAQYQANTTPPSVVSFDNKDTDILIWGTQWLAYDISKLLTTEHLQFFEELITKELNKEENSDLVFHFMKYYGDIYDDDIKPTYEICRNLWIVLRDLLSRELKERAAGLDPPPLLL